MIVVDVHLVRVVPGAATDPVLVDRLGPHDWNAIASPPIAIARSPLAPPPDSSWAVGSGSIRAGYR
jgi:hypothetical protein